MKQGIEDVVVQQGVSEDLGMKYVGPGGRPAAKPRGHGAGSDRRPQLGGPVIVHTIAEGSRLPPARLDENDQFHFRSGW
ncbi:hypothetical protein QJS66_04765 [Kocuria rhizophila]|nr:hypothetical protein QJS66_04765 [Kocuria rhizophila]